LCLPTLSETGSGLPLTGSGLPLRGSGLPVTGSGLPLTGSGLPYTGVLEAIVTPFLAVSMFAKTWEVYLQTSYRLLNITGRLFVSVSAVQMVFLLFWYPSPRSSRNSRFLNPNTKAGNLILYVSSVKFTFSCTIFLSQTILD